MVEIKPRRLLNDDNPDGYLESDKDFVLNNITACLIFLEQELGPLKPRYEYLKTVLGELGEGSCCQTPGCCEDDPMCDPMTARAGIREVS